MNIEWLKTALDAIGVTKKIADVQPLVSGNWIPVVSRTEAVGMDVGNAQYVQAQRYYNDGPEVRLLWQVSVGTADISARDQIQFANGKFGVLIFQDGIIEHEHFGAYGDGVTLDDVAIAQSAQRAVAKGCRIRPRGRIYAVSNPIDFRGYTGLRLDGVSQQNYYWPGIGQRGATQYLQTTDNVPVMRLGISPNISGIVLTYQNQQTNTNTGAVALELNRFLGASIRNITASKAAVSFGIAQTSFGGISNGDWATASNLVYDTEMCNLRSYSASITHYDLRNYAGGGTNTRIGPLYINGARTLGWTAPGQSCQYGMRIGTWSGLEIQALSVDGVDFSIKAFEILNSMVRFTTLRFEECQVTADASNWFTIDGATNTVDIENLELSSCRVTNAIAPNGQHLFRINAPATGKPRQRLNVGSIRFVNNGLGESSKYTAPYFRLLSICSGMDDESAISIGPVQDEVGMGINVAGNASNWYSQDNFYQRTPVRIFAGRRVSELVRNGNNPTTTGWSYIRYADWTNEGVAGSGATNILPPAAYGSDVQTFNYGDKIIAVGQIPVGAPAEWVCVSTGFVGKATGTITFNTNPSNGDTVTINSIVITFVSGTPTGAQVKIDVDAPSTAKRLTDYINANTATLTVSAVQLQSIITITANTSGSGGNSISLAKTGTNITVSGTTLSGGTTPYAGTWACSKRHGNGQATAISADADMSINPWWLSDLLVESTALTADRTLTLAEGSRAQVGIVRIHRRVSSTGAFVRRIVTSSIPGTPLASLSSGQYCEVRWDAGSSKWILHTPVTSISS